MRIIRNILILFLLLSAGCGFQRRDDSSILFWALGGEAEQLKKLIPRFERDNPGITVNVQMIPWTAAQEKLITAYAGDNLPDAGQIGNTWIPQFAELNAISRLDNRIAESAIIDSAEYFKGIWDTNVMEGELFGIPWYVDTRVLFYRTDVLERGGYKDPPKTWDEFYDACKKIRADKAGKDQYAIYLPANEWASFVIFGLQNGAGILKDNNRYADFSSREFEEAFNYIINFHREGLAPVGISQVTNIYQAFAEEYISMYISGPWNIPEFKKWMRGGLKDKWMTAPLPGRYEYPGVSLAGGSSLVLFENSSKKEAAWKFIEYLSRPEIQLEFYKLINNLPAVKKAWEYPELKNDKYMKAFFEQFQNVKATPKIPEWEQIVFSKLQQYAEYAIRGSMSTGEALNRLDADADRILDKRRWLIAKYEEEKNAEKQNQ